MKTWNDPESGRSYHSDLPRPFVVMAYPQRDRHFGSLDAARSAAPAGARIFFEWATGTGTRVR